MFGFTAGIDPWGMLPVSLPLARAPVSTNARFSMPALARDARFDSAVIGSSSSRLLRPERLDALFGGRFANLAMNAATAWEQSRMLGLFARTHPGARTVIVGLDTAWCTQSPERLTGRPFPGWMYAGSRWRGYREMLTLYAVQESGSELWTALGLKRPRYGLDGYTRFVPPEADYDPARVAAAFARWGLPPTAPDTGAPIVLPALPMLGEALAALPAATRKLVFFAPAQLGHQGAPGSAFAATMAACKTQVTAMLAGAPNATVVDFLRPSPITSDVANYWDPVHYRLPIADRIADDLAAALDGRAAADDAVLLP